ncbi:MAG: GrpB family protein [Candidatus Bipolaricaulia bacterium]
MLPDQQSAGSTIRVMHVTLVHEYDPRWPDQFRELASLLERELAGLFLRIEHVGSTAIPGMTAKPIIDLVVVIEPARLPEVIERLAAFGFQHEGDRGIPGREAFRPIEGTPAASLPRQHLYVCPEGNRSLEEQLAFRDFLRTHPDQARRLSAHKRALCIEHDNDKDLYIAGKSEMVREIIRLAMPDGACLAP